MTDLYPPGSEDLELFSSPVCRLPFIYRYQIPPFVLGVASLIVIFFLYQIVGGAITVLFFGFDPHAGQVSGFRIATAAGQIAFILLPTFFLVRLASFRPMEYFRARMPESLPSILFALVGIFSLQQMLQVYLSFQDKIPLPSSIEHFLAPIKQALEDLTKMLVTSNSRWELTAVLFVIAFVPAICEEFLFRGLVQRSFEQSFGRKYGVLYTGIIFGAYHLNPFEFIPLAALGVYLGFVAMRANSIWVSACGHFFNNALAVVRSEEHTSELQSQ